MGPGYRRVTAPLASSTAPWASLAPAPRAGPGGATEQHTARLGLILLHPHHQLPFGHGLCCWNKRNVLSCGSVRAGWGWQGTHLQHGGLAGTQAGPTPRGAGAGIGRRLCQRLAPRRAQGAELSSCSPARAPKPQRPTFPQMFILHQPSTQAQKGQCCLGHKEPDTHS